ncbi:fimbrial protein, partial [Escherichia coli]|uniref:fimbrial protein n=1 Tax=Escherichia coli TaxID=562 RepID=UPI001130B783
PFPTTSATPRVVYNSRTVKPWPAAPYLTPVSSPDGLAITAGSLLAVPLLRHTNTSNSDDFHFMRYLYVNNDVLVPTGRCHVPAGCVPVNLPAYHGSVTL